MAQSARQLSPYDSEEQPQSSTPGEVIRPHLGQPGEQDDSSSTRRTAEPQTPAELLERIPTMSPEQGRQLDKQSGMNAGPPAARPRQAPRPADPVYDEPSGTAPSDPRAGLRTMENGNGSDKATEAEGAASKDKEAPSRDDLSGSEEKGGAEPVQHENQVGRGWQPGEKQHTRFTLGGRLTRRRGIFGGGIVAIVVSILLLLTNLQGPFGFLHFAQLLEKFHFSTLQNEQDNRFMKVSRYVRYASKGEVEKARLSFLGNKFANRFETKLNAGGLSSAYTDKFGLFDGYVIDRNNENFKGKTDDQIKQIIKDTYGVDAVEGSTITGHGNAIKGELVVKASDLGYAKTFKLNYQVLRQAGYNKLSAAIGARLFCQKAGCTWHPLKKLGIGNASDVKRKLEDWTRKNNEAISEGQEAVTLEPDPNSPDPDNNDPQKTTEAGNKQETGDSIKGVSGEAQSVKSGEKTIGDFKGSLVKGIGGGGAAAVGVLCTIKAINDKSGEIKEAQVVLPLIRLAIELMAVGGQIESGQDVDLNELKQLYTQMVGKDSQTGKITSYDEAQPIQHNLGDTDNGVPPNSTLTTIDKGSPFDSFLGKVPGLNTACSTAGQIGIGALSIGLDFTGIGAVIGQLLGGVATSLAASPLINQAADWLAGQAVDVASLAGADYGNAADFGAALAANSQNLTSGGQALSSGQAVTLANLNNQWDREEFNQQSIAYRLFSPDDQRSAISKVIDSSSPSLTQNIAKMGSMFTNFGQMFASVPKLFTPAAHADTTPYDYGFPTYGFSEQDMDNPAIQNPYQNACYVVGCQGVPTDDGSTQNITGFLTGTTDGSGQGDSGWITRAQDCFGVSIQPVTVQTDNGEQQQWDVTPGSSSLPNPYGNSQYENDHHCGDPAPADCTGNTSDACNWLRLRFFILDTETMNSMGCYAGDDQACSDVGFENTPTIQSSPTGGSSSTSNGLTINNQAAQQVAQSAGTNVKVGYALS
ncbi:MAG TPA: hypothetical protein VFP32_03225, partial [Candidatus Saccharimonadales bacterium]|nr:hypothetical protein [Candidatus Saccharimonadales bacterium]